jgi:predicted metal-dependent peptidase
MDIAQLSKRLQKGHITLLSNDETRFYASAIMIGKSEIVDDVPTACTDGRNKFYGSEFMSKLSDEDIAGIVLHENMHVILMHMARLSQVRDKDPQTFNAAADYVVNSVIHNLKGYGKWISLPGKHLYDPKFDGWSLSEVYNFLTKGVKPEGEQEEIKQPPPRDNQNGQQQQSGGSGNEQNDGDGDEDESDSGGGGKVPEPTSVNIGGKEYSLETHDDHREMELDKAQSEELTHEINEAVQQATALAGVLGADLPRAFVDAAKPEVNWREEVFQFFSEFTRGTEEYSWRRYDRRRMADDQLTPSRYDERIKELALCVDASGSMWGELFNKACSAVMDAIEQIDPEVVRVMFWDTDICSDQAFEDNYNGVREALRPRGGGGTRAACVVEHVEKMGYNPSCIVMITDGYLEHDLTWETHIPTLWLVLESERFAPPRGRKVLVK